MKLGKENILGLGCRLLEQLIERESHIHLVGVGGIGMSGIARILVARGYRVSGSDLVENKLTKALARLGVEVTKGHDAKLLGDSDVVVVSSAVGEDNPEVQGARSRGIPVVLRATMLAHLMKGYFRIAVAGSHGKTTTTSLAASLLIKAGQDPSYVIGGILSENGVNAHLGEGDTMLVEADESDGSFLNYAPDIGIITNIDSDHLQTFDNSLEQLEEAFFQFMNSVKTDGYIILCLDDPRLRRLAERCTRKVISYSTRLESADYYADSISIKDAKSHFTVYGKTGAPTAFEFSLPGHHNVANALACVALADLMGIERAVLAEGLKCFGGVGRRFQLYPVRRQVLVDDYGHHPREIDATIEAAKLNWPQRRLVLIFQPHRYTRTEQLFDDFVSALKQVDHLVLLDVHTAGEAYIHRADSDALANAVSEHNDVDVFRVKGLRELIKHAGEHFQKEDVMVMQGAGSIGGMVKPFVEALHVITR